MTINPATNNVELTANDIRQAIALYLRQEKFNIYCDSADVLLNGSHSAIISVWNNMCNEESFATHDYTAIN